MPLYARRVRTVLWVVLALNAAVAVAKLVVGARAGSLAVVGDGLHSGVDALSNVVGLVVLHFATRPPDEDHPFGHAKYETLAAFALAGVLMFTSFELARAAILRLLAPRPPAFSSLTVAVMVVTLVVNLAVARFEGREGRRVGSELLQADAAQTRADVFVTLAVLAGIGVQRFGHAWLDPLLAVGVAGLIAGSGYAVFRRALPVLSDAIAHDPRDVARIVHEVPGVESVHDIRSWHSGRDSFVQMHLVVGPDDVRGAHAVADEVERRVEEELGAREVFVHVEPEDDASGPPGSRGEPVDKG